MSSPPQKFQILPLHESDIPTVVSIYFKSFTNPHSQACWPRIPSVRNWWEGMISSELHEDGAFWIKVITTTGREGKGEGEIIVGFAKWIEPKPGIEPDTTLPTWPEGADTELCDETFSAWFDMHKKLFGSRGHWYLEIIAVDPTFQGLGAGSLMLNWGTTRADQESQEAYLEASPDAVSIYEKFGFREVARTEMWIENERVKKGVWYRNLFMIRRPRPSSCGMTTTTTTTG